MKNLLIPIKIKKYKNSKQKLSNKINNSKLYNQLEQILKYNSIKSILICYSLNYLLNKDKDGILLFNLHLLKMFKDLLKLNKLSSKDQIIPTLPMPPFKSHKIDKVYP